MSLTQKDVDTLGWKYNIIDRLHIFFSESGSLSPPHSTGSIAPCYYESTLIVVGVIFPHRTRIVTFSFSKPKKKVLRYPRERSAAATVQQRSLEAKTDFTFSITFSI